MKILRLLITPDCNRSCAGCCNKQWNIEALPIVKSFDCYDQIILTGGEPLMDSKILNTVWILKALGSVQTELYVYTAHARNVKLILNHVDGVTLTIHEQKDLKDFIALNEFLLKNLAYHGLSLRLNVFDEVSLPSDLDLSLWKVKSNIEWIEDCPLPTDEEFMRIETFI
jgi:hypothetical protein